MWLRGHNAPDDTFWVADGLAEKLKMGWRRFAAARKEAIATQKGTRRLKAKSRISLTYAVFHRCRGILAAGLSGSNSVVTYFVRSARTGLIWK